MRVYYFGCYRESGHYYWNPALEKESKAHTIVPWGHEIDSDLYNHAYGGTNPKNTAIVLHKDGWSALVITDNTVDKRPNSKSAFIFEKPNMGFFELCTDIQHIFKELVTRIG